MKNIVCYNCTVGSINISDFMKGDVGSWYDTSFKFLDLNYDVNNPESEHCY